eukprot:g12881.t1
MCSHGDDQDEQDKQMDELEHETAFLISNSKAVNKAPTFVADDSNSNFRFAGGRALLVLLLVLGVGLGIGLTILLQLGKRKPPVTTRTAFVGDFSNFLRRGHVQKEDRSGSPKTEKLAGVTYMRLNSEFHDWMANLLADDASGGRLFGIETASFELPEVLTSVGPGVLPQVFENGGENTHPWNLYSDPVHTGYRGDRFLVYISPPGFFQDAAAVAEKIKCEVEAKDLVAAASRRGSSGSFEIEVCAHRQRMKKDQRRRRAGVTFGKTNCGER